MRCSQIQKLISNYLDKSVSVQERAIIDEHLKSCAKCRRETELLKNLGEKLDLIKPTGAPDDFSRGVLAIICKGNAAACPEKSKLLLWKRLIAAGAVAAVLLMTVIAANIVGKVLYHEYAQCSQEKAMPIINTCQVFLL